MTFARGVFLPLLLQLFTYSISAQTLFNPDVSTVQTEYNPTCNTDRYSPPRCARGSNDPVTRQLCTKYGYDCIWEITDITRPPSTHRRIEVNNHWPPPSVRVMKGDRIRIALVNKMDEDVTLHFHGLLMEGGYTIMDGPQHLTQAGVKKGKIFVYDFPATKAGTYWIHSHAPGQYPKGLRSPLVIVDDTEPTTLDYDPNSDVAIDKVVTLSDHFNNFWLTETSYGERKCGDGLELPPQNQLFNEIPPGSTGNARQWVKMKPGVRSRIRFINTSAHSRYYVFIQGAVSMDVIEIDGVTLARNSPQHVTEGIELAPGQRVSVAVKFETGWTTKRIMAISDRRINAGQPNSVYGYCKLPLYDSTNSDLQYVWGWLVNADANPNTYTYPPPDATEISSYSTGSRSWLRSWNEGLYVDPFYKYRPKLPFKDQVRSDNKLNPDYAWNFNELAFIPKESIAAWTPDDTTALSPYIHKIELKAAAEGWGLMGSALFLPPDKQNAGIPKNVQSDADYPLLPTLLRALRVKTDDSDLLNPRRYVNEDNQAAQTIVIPSKDAKVWFAIRTLVGDHPIHLHGHEFQIIAKLALDMTSANKPKSFTDSPVDFAAVKTEALKLTNPPRRDTLMIEKGYTYIIAIQASNPGVWAMHCHNDFHAKSGMFMQVVEAPAALRSLLGRLDFMQGTGLGFNWNFRTTLSNMDLAKAKWLYQTISKAFESYGYTDPAIYCTDKGTSLPCNP